MSLSDGSSRFLAYVLDVPLLTSESDVRSTFHSSNIDRVTFTNPKLDSVDVTIEFVTEADRDIALQQPMRILREVECSIQLRESDMNAEESSPAQSDLLNEYLELMELGDVSPTPPTKLTPDVISTEPPFVCFLGNVPASVSFSDLCITLSGYSVIGFSMPTIEDRFVSVTFSKREDLVNILKRTDIMVGATLVTPTLTKSTSIDDETEQNESFAENVEKPQSAETDKDQPVITELEDANQERKVQAESNLSDTNPADLVTEQQNSYSTKCVSEFSKQDIGLKTESSIIDNVLKIDECDECSKVDNIKEQMQLMNLAVDTLYHHKTASVNAETSVLDEPAISKDPRPATVLDKPDEAATKPNNEDPNQEINFNTSKVPNTVQTNDTNHSRAIFQSINISEIPFYPPFIVFVYGYPIGCIDSEFYGSLPPNAEVLAIDRFPSAIDGSPYLKIEFGRRNNLVEMVTNKGHLNISLAEMVSLKSTDAKGVPMKIPGAKIIVDGLTALPSNAAPPSSYQNTHIAPRPEIKKMPIAETVTMPSIAISNTIPYTHSEKSQFPHSNYRHRDTSAESGNSKMSTYSKKPYYYKKKLNHNFVPKNHQPSSTIPAGIRPPHKVVPVGMRTPHNMVVPAKVHQSVQVSKMHPSPSASAGHGMCMFCAQDTDKACGRCGRFYCSIMCQQVDWPHHSRICTKMPELIPFAAFNPNAASVNPIALTEVKTFASPNNGIAKTAQNVVANAQPTKNHKATIKTIKVPSVTADKNIASVANNNAPAANQNANEPILVAKPILPPSNVLETKPNHVNPFKQKPGQADIKNKKQMVTATTPSQIPEHNTVRPLAVPSPCVRESITIHKPVTPVQFVPPQTSQTPLLNKMPINKAPTNTASAALKSSPPCPPPKTLDRQEPIATSTSSNLQPTNSYNNSPLHKPMQRAKINVPYCNIPAPNSDVTITAIISDKHVFVRPLDTDSDKQYLAVIADIATYAKNYSKPLEQMPVLGQVILARKPENTTEYRRAMVLKISDPNIYVAFIDYGDMAMVTWEDCHDLSADLQQLQRFVHRCTIAVSGNSDKIQKLLNTSKRSAMQIKYDEPFDSKTIVHLHYKSSGLSLEQVMLNI